MRRRTGTSQKLRQVFLECADLRFKQAATWRRRSWEWHSTENPGDKSPITKAATGCGSGHILYLDGAKNASSVSAMNVMSLSVRY